MPQVKPERNQRRMIGLQERTPRGLPPYYERREDTAAPAAATDLLGQAVLRATTEMTSPDSLAPAWSIKSDLELYGNVPETLMFGVINRPIVEAQ